MTEDLRPTSFAMQRYRQVVGRRGVDELQANAPLHMVDDRDWIRPSGELDDRQTDNYPVYNDITGIPIPGTTGGLIGVMTTG